MPNTHVDYDHIAANYDRRYTGSDDPDPVLDRLRSAARELDAQRVLEVGCGTGHWLARLQPNIPGAYGLDRSTGMLDHAKSRCASLRLVQGCGGRLPFAAGSFDILYCINAIHHFSEQRRFIFEARRLLRRGGVLTVCGTDPRDKRDSWYIYKYFDGVYQTDLKRFPSWRTVHGWMAEAGFTQITLKPARRIEQTFTGEDVFNDPFLQKDQVSQLALLDDEAYAAGIGRMKEAIRRVEVAGEAVVFRTSFFTNIMTGCTE
jgi:ubiquinone/menaquinone biosynthesis C-methylase UbiE